MKTVATDKGKKSREESAPHRAVALTNEISELGDFDGEEGASEDKGSGHANIK